MQPYDYLMLFVLGGLTIYGYAKGMAWQIAYLTSFFFSYFVAVKFSDQLAPIFGDAVPWNKFMAMAAIYIGFSFVTWMIFRNIKGGIDKVRLESFDHQMGALIGAARGVLWCVGITFFAVTLLPDSQKHQVVASQSGRYIAKLLDGADSIMPPEVHQVIGPHLEQLETELNQGQGGLAAPTPDTTNPYAFTSGQSQPAQPTPWQAPSSNWPATPQQPSGSPSNSSAWPLQSQQPEPWE